MCLNCNNFKSTVTGALKGYWSESKWGQAFLEGSDPWHQEPSPRGRKSPHTKMFTVVLFVVVKPKYSRRSLLCKVWFSHVLDYSRSQPLSGKQHWAGCWEQEPVSSVSQPAPHLRVKASLRGSPHPPRRCMQQCSSAGDDRLLRSEPRQG